MLGQWRANEGGGLMQGQLLEDLKPTRTSQLRELCYHGYPTDATRINAPLFYYIAVRPANLDDPSPGVNKES